MLIVFCGWEFSWAPEEVAKLLPFSAMMLWTLMVVLSIPPRYRQALKR